jgi:uncharacterized damage-inducible protein DinB
MPERIIEKLFEHNNWANHKLIKACSGLSDEKLDAQPASAAYGNIRQTMIHLVSAQVGYLKLLTRPVEERRQARIDLDFSGLSQAAAASGEGLLKLACGEGQQLPETRIETTSGYWVDPWVVLVQSINHADEHREQVCSQLSALDLEPPALDGWTYGEASGALVSVDGS